MSDETYLVLVDTADEVVENIYAYNQAVKSDERISSSMARARAWYAIEKNGQYLLGPSRAIGYKGFDADSYLAAVNKDGRRTEERLQEMATLVVDNSAKTSVSLRHPKARELSSALSNFLAKYGQTPNKGCRISLIEMEQEEIENGDSVHIQAIIELITRLPSQSIEVLKRRVADL